ncbi:hypothetical protein B0H10DRAFT_2212724 [Mycena sp. CBHHK59/15]|nr:hypothetical protein B0H10DRAFT_2212724 [Mycena sp. CBHHK59/15]
MAKASEKKRNRTYKRTAKQDRRNLKLWAEGAREELLKPHIPAYTDALERGWRAERDYLLVVCQEYHAQIPWRLADHEEPEMPLPEYDPFAKPVVEGPEVAEAPQDGPGADPWAILLAKLAGINSPPKARQAFQQYMHESYDTEIAPAVNARWLASCLEADGITLKSRKGPNAPFRAQVARELYNELSAKEQEGLRSRAREEAKEAKEKYTNP